MKNLRITSVSIDSSIKITVNFTEKLNKNITVDNFTIASQTVGVPDSKVLSIKVLQDYVELTCQPLTPYAAYFINVNNTLTNLVQSLNGDALLLEDNVANRQLIIGPAEPGNAVRDFFKNFLRDNIYNIDDTNTIVHKVIESFVNNLSKALNDVRQIKNENYLKFEVVDEEKTRGEGPFDRLDEEAAYEVKRVALRKTGSRVASNLNIDYFPFYPVTLQSTKLTESLSISSSNEEGKFNINELILNLNKFPVTKLNKVTFTLSTLPLTYEYPINVYGYQIRNNRYDQEYGFTYYALNDNQIKLNSNILSSIDFNLENIIKVDVEFEYKDLGKIIYPDTLSLTKILTSNREVLPPSVNIFDLKHAPIVDTSGKIYSLNGVNFISTISVLEKHPAFLYEIPFRLNALPSSPGFYSIDYSVGRVYVYGADKNNLGTGAEPPVATYNYKYSYQNEIDYVFDSDSNDLVSLPNGNLRENEVTINLEYEKVLVPGVDYVADVHKELMSERIQNRLLNLGTLQTTQSPITNVFRVYNETSGEIYAISRWDQDKVYFNFNIAPRLQDKNLEKSTFETVTNELLTVNKTFNNSHGKIINEIYLNNSNLIGYSEDCIGSSINSSVSFSKNDIFVKEKFYERLEDAQFNYNKLINVGEYCIDYVNGIIYSAVDSAQSSDIGTISYKKDTIVSENAHIISVNDIYYRINPLLPKNKTFNYLSFSDNTIIPVNLQFSDEQYANNNENLIYQIFNQKIGFFEDTTFYSKVSEQIKSIRGVFEYQDLLNSTNPINFGLSSTFNNSTIKVNSVNNLDNPLITSILDDYDGPNYYLYVPLPQNIPYLSPNINFNISIVRNSDGKQLWDGSGVILPSSQSGDPVRLVLSGFNSPALGESVTLVYQISINNLSRVIVDYNKGDLYIDYTYLADEIIVSYEYGENNLDFRKSLAISPNQTYYVTYKVGALRDALLKNFGSLLNISELNTFNVTLDRERYRDALIAAMTSAIQGPTINAIKNLIGTITHIPPEIVESVFNNWSLGNSLLYLNPIETTGSFAFLPAKYNNGVLINQSDQSISLPASSNLSLTQGTFESWISPQWNGIDNNTILSVKVLKDNNLLSKNLIFIGQSEVHPELNQNDGYTFQVSKDIVNKGVPQKNKNGVFIYYAPDSSNLFDRWYVNVIDNNATGSIYNIEISIKDSAGMFYDTKTLSGSTNVLITTRKQKLNIKFSNFVNLNEEVTFISDKEHYLLDVGDKDLSRNRISIYKDVSGYLNFRVYDRLNNSYSISSDVSSWKSGDLHFISASWKLNTDNNQDEMHLFIDGFEVPNIIKYNQKLGPYLHEKYRTVDPEKLIGLSTGNIFGSNDLSTVAGSNSVTSSINFNSYGAEIGNILYIEDPAFNPNGYVITGINGNFQLTLANPMPVTLTDLTFVVNKTSYTLQTEAAIYPNIAVATLSSTTNSNDFATTLSNNEVTSSNLNYNLVKPGYLLRLLDNNFELTYNIISVDSINNKIYLDQDMPVSLTGIGGYVYSNEETEIPGIKALYPSYNITTDSNYNSIITFINNINKNDLIILTTLGLNHRKVHQSYYVWSNQAENVIQTRLPAPISLDDVKIYKVIAENKVINKFNSTVIGSTLTSTLSCVNPSNSEIGRSLTGIISGTNVDFSNPVSITISGIGSDFLPLTETIQFTNYGKVNFTNKFISISSATITCTPININRDCLAVKVRETYSITKSEDSGLVPIVKYSYQMAAGVNLSGEGYTVSDASNFISFLNNNNILIVHSPISAAGYYKITNVSQDHHTFTIESTNASANMPLPSFTDGYYKILNVTDQRTGLQNGFFVLQQDVLTGTPYLLRNGYYDFEYFTYLNIKFDPFYNEKIYIGSDIMKNCQLDGIIDSVKIYSIMLTDTRVGETISANQRSVTKDFNSLTALRKDLNTLVLLNFDSYPFINLADYYKKYLGGNFIQSSVAVNDSFSESVLINKNPIILDNDGVLNTKTEGTIEFWVNPFYDTANDPDERYYFDAYGAKIINTISYNNSTVKINEEIGNVISVTLADGNPDIDYFAGGRLEIDNANAVLEETISISDTIVKTNNKILQVISVKIQGDLSQQDYFSNGIIGPDKLTIYLGKQLPNNTLNVIVTYKTIVNSNNKLNRQLIRLNKKLPKDNSNVIVKYIPKGFQGDRISIYKDRYGILNFNILASGQNYTVASPIYWSKNSWHRVQVTYKINSSNNSDEMRLFVDGYQRSMMQLTGNMLLNPFFSLNAMQIGPNDVIDNITFKDSLNQLYIGSDYSLTHNAYCLIDNLRISNVARNPYEPYGEPLDPYYSSNLDTANPVVEDLYTTYLLNFDSMTDKNTDFAFIVAKEGSYFDFTINIFDSFGIVNSSDTVKQILEKLISEFKPANTRAFINYSS